jgi:hypothetical protein
MIDEIYSDLDRLSRLPENWNSYNADPIRMDVIAAARDFASRYEFAQKPWVVPTSSGGVQFEWIIEGRELELEFDSTQITYTKAPNANPASWIVKTIPVDDDAAVTALLKWLFEGDNATE